MGGGLINHDDIKLRGIGPIMVVEPQNISELRRFLGMASKFAHNLAETMKPHREP